MHRKRTHLAPRFSRVGSRLEHRGIVATYEFHDRLGANAVGRRRFTRHEPVLDGVQQRIVDDVRRDGFAALPFSELFPDPVAGRSSMRAPPGSSPTSRRGSRERRQASPRSPTDERVWRSFPDTSLTV